MKKYIALLTMMVMVSLTSCFEEYDEGYDLIGRVATVPVFTISSSSAAPGSTITANFRYYSEHEPVTTLRLIETINDEERVAATKEVTGHNLADSYEDSFTYEVPNVAEGTSIKLQVEVETANGLSNRNIPTLDRTLTVTAPAE